MSLLQFRFESTLPYSREHVFSWHEKKGAIKRLTPPWQSVKVLKPSKSLKEGETVELEMKIGPLKKKWVALHTEYRPPELFKDEQVSGPFAEFKHEHRFEVRDQHSCRMIDDIRYALPFGLFGRVAGEESCSRELTRAFSYRHRTLARDLDAISSLNAKPLRILISGASGLVGSSLSAFLENAGHTVEPLVRYESKDFVSWSKESGIQNLEKLETFDGVIHLAGANISGKRWTEAYKKEILESRVLSTRHLVDAFQKISRRPEFFLCASAVGFYGDRGDERLEESSPAGQGFLAEVCKEWEAEAKRAFDLTRAVQMRIGVVLSPAGGALKTMLPAFKLGLAGKLGSGKQWMSWISLDDLIYAISFLATRNDLSGVFNMVSGTPLRNSEFTQELAHSLHRWVGPPAPSSVLKLAAGELAEQLLLASIKVEPKRLWEAGFRFRDPSLAQTLKHQLSLI